MRRQGRLLSETEWMSELWKWWKINNYSSQFFFNRPALAGCVRCFIMRRRVLAGGYSALRNANVALNKLDLWTFPEAVRAFSARFWVTFLVPWTLADGVTLFRF